MRSRLVLQPAVEFDLAEARDWYEARRRGLGADFLSAVDSVFGRIADHPHSYPKVYGHVRRAVVRRFPYLVYFTIDDDLIRVIACLHARRRPDTIRART